MKAKITLAIQFNILKHSNQAKHEYEEYYEYVKKYLQYFMFIVVII